MANDRIDIFLPDDSHSDFPMVGDVKAGFPSPAEDFAYESLDITRLIVRNPASTFYARVSGNSMVDDSISEGDILVVDKSIEPYNNCIAICFIDGEFTLKHVELHSDHAMLIPANKKYKPIKVDADNQFIIWGVVSYVIKKL